MMVKFNLRILKVRVSFLLLLSIVLIFCSAVFAEETVSAATEQFNQGMDYLNAGQYAQAKQIFKNLATDISGKEVEFSSEAGIADVVYRVADCYRKQKDGKAIELYQYILSKHPSHSRAVRAQYGLASCYIQKKEDTKAQAAIEKLLTDYSAHPDIVEVILDLANKHGSIFELYQHIVSNYPSHDLAVRAQYRLARCYIQKNEDSKAQAAIKKLLTDYSAHPDIVKVIGDVAYIYRRQNKYDRLIALYQDILSKHPSHNLAVRAQAGLARCYMEKKEDSKAQATVEKLLSNYSDHPDIVKVVGRLADKCYEGKGYDRAVQLYQYILSKYPSHNWAVHAQAGLARCYIHKNEDVKAQAVDEKLLANYSDHPDIAECIGAVAGSYRGKKDDRAIELYQFILSKYPSHNWAVRAQAGLARCYIQKNEDVKAQAAVEKLQSNYSDHPDIVECIASVAGSYRSKKYDRTVELYQFILSKYPSHNWVDQARSDDDIIEVFAVLADSYRKKKTDRAIELYQYILSDHFSDHRRVRKWKMHAQYRLARIYIDRKDYPKAEVAVKKLLANYSDRSKIAEYIGRIAESYPREKYDRATELYQLILSKHPSHWAMLATKEIVVTAIKAGDEQTARSYCNNIINNYMAEPGVAREFMFIGEEYYRKALSGDSGSANDPDLYFTRTVEICKCILERMPPLSEKRWLAEVHEMLASSYLYLSDFESALEYGQMLVDNCPDYEFIWRGQSIVGSSYEGLKRLGTISEEQADEKIKAVYQEIIIKYPGRTVAEYAQEWLDLYNTKLK